MRLKLRLHVFEITVYVSKDWCVQPMYI